MLAQDAHQGPLRVLTSLQQFAAADHGCNASNSDTGYFLCVQ